MDRIGPGNLVAALGGVVLLIGMFFLNWYGVGDAEIDTFGAWEEQGFLGTIANLIMVAAAASSLGIVFSAARGQTVSEASASASLVLALAAVAMVVLRMIFPVDEVNGFEFDASLEAGIFTTLAGALIVLAGRMLASQERGDTYI
ncbi:MAG: hypothetical protein AABM29_01600 [Actinomycetota bacterium]